MTKHTELLPLMRAIFSRTKAASRIYTDCNNITHVSIIHWRKAITFSDSNRITLWVKLQNYIREYC